ncbi:MAG: glycosyltransferase family 2 protein [Ignavibacteriales bacterium]|nr:glycosyltransferase family 2 protein [Ignavibacteriales bacterium]
MPELSLCMIVKDEEKHLTRSLSSVKDVVNEIVIVDTGSSDKTIEIAKSFSAKIFHFDWVNDFSAARNFALSKCPGDWILYLDADEELKPDSIEEVKKYKSHTPAGVYCTVKSLGSSTANGSVMRYPRLFANVPGLEFVGKVHEQISDSLRKNKIPLVESEIEIIHHGYAIDEDGLQKKKERNLSLLLSNENKKSNVYDKLKLIQTLISLDKYDEAEVRAKNVINSKFITAADLCLAMFYMAQIKYENNDLNAANSFALRSYKKLSDKPELNYLLYLINNRINNIGEAFKFITLCISSNKQLLEKKSKIESENILDQTDLYLRAINLSLKLDKTNRC